MLYPKEVGERCSLLNLATNALLCIWSSSACRRVAGKGWGREGIFVLVRGVVLNCTSPKQIMLLFTSFFLFFFFFPSSGIGSYCWEHPVLPGCQIAVRRWAGVQGVVPRDVGRHALEEADREDGQDRLALEGVVGEERMVRELHLHLFCPHLRQQVPCVSSHIWRGVRSTLKRHVGPKPHKHLNQNSGAGESGHHLAVQAMWGLVPHFPHLMMLLSHCDKWDTQTAIFTPSCHSVQIKKLCTPQGTLN